MATTQDDWRDFNTEVEEDSHVTRQGPQCKTCKLINSLHGDAADELEKALSQPVMASASIRRALLSRVDNRQVPSAYSIARHRRGDCRLGGKAK